MSVRAGRMQDASLPNTSSQQRSDVADLPPPYKVRENPAAALARRVARPPNASVEVYNTEAHRGSRRSLDQRVFQSNSGVIRLGCALLLLGLLVSCTAFALALVSFSANDTQHLQQQVRKRQPNRLLRSLVTFVFRCFFLSPLLFSVILPRWSTYCVSACSSMR